MTEKRVSTILNKLNSASDTSTDIAVLTSEEITWLCITAKKIFLDQPTLLELKPPLTVCGDILGHFHDLKRLFQIGGVPPSTNYLFLGNYVDGPGSIETISLLLCYKILYPINFFLLRGSHESRINDEYALLYTKPIWKPFFEVFDCLPIAAIIDDKIFCVHGGISPDLESMDDIKYLKRPMEVCKGSLVYDLLWSNPDTTIDTWFNDDSLCFGADAVDTFLAKFGFDLICRGHQIVPDGYEFPFYPSQTLVTVFSGYQDYINKGALLKIDDSLFCTFSIIEDVSTNDQKSKPEIADQDKKHESKPEIADQDKKHESKQEIADQDKIHESKQETIIELEKKLKESEEEIKNSKKTISQLEKELNEARKGCKNAQNLSSPSFNPFEDEIKEDQNQNHFIGEDDADFYKIVKKIGEGATAIAYKVIDTRTNQALCKKVLKVQDESNAFRNVQNMIKEFEALCLIRHPCICRAIGMNTAEPIEGTESENEGDKVPTTISIYLEFLNRSLKESIDKKLLDNTLKVRIVIEIVHAMLYIHKHGMIHRDIKVENIMLNSGFEAKVIDFGLARIDECFNGQSFVSTSMTKGIGTLSYMSPEMINEEEYNNKTDVYSFGILLCYIFTGKLPNINMRDKMIGKPISLPTPSSSISKACIDLILKCTSFEPDSRPSFEKILKEIRDNSYELASEIDKSLIKRRDNELSFYESIKT